MIWKYSVKTGFGDELHWLFGEKQHRGHRRGHMVKKKGKKGKEAGYTQMLSQGADIHSIPFPCRS
jgi:hypothetical protein